MKAHACENIQILCHSSFDGTQTECEVYTSHVDALSVALSFYAKRCEDFYDKDNDDCSVFSIKSMSCSTIVARIDGAKICNFLLKANFCL